MKLLFKNTFKKIKKSLGRFFSIMVIIGVGVSVFLGLRESTSTILYTADKYYDDKNLMDFKIISTYGLTDGDLDSLKKLKNSEVVIPTYSLDILINSEAIRLHALEDKINNYELVKGRKIKKTNECLGDYTKYKLNQVIYFKKEENSILKINQCKIVGLIKTPLYLRAEKGVARVGNGRLISFLYLDKNAFSSDYYTEIYLIGKKTQKQLSYEDSYKKETGKLRKELEELKPIRETIRYEEILEKATKKIVDEENKFNKEKEKNEKELEKVRKKLAKAQEEIDNGFSKIEKATNDLKSRKNELEEELSKEGININHLEDTINKLKQDLYLLPEGLEKEKLKGKIKKLEEVFSGYKMLNQELVKLEEEKSNLEVKNKELKENKDKYLNNKKQFNNKIKEAQEKIQKAKDDLKSIEKPVWYLLDRSDNNGYNNYADDVLKVGAIAKIIPIFFLVLSILMALNTISRLVEEERTELGILRAMGFSNRSIIFSYLFYIYFAATIGLLLGYIIGYSTIPQIIYGAFLPRYYLPKLIVVVSPLVFVFVLLITYFVMSLVTVILLKIDLKEVTANLLRVKPPKEGKKVFLENFGLWKNVSFMWKITIRNLFRYKKRVFMTIIGISGCTALLLTGFGLNDSINQISKVQYQDIIKYKAIYTLNNKVNDIPFKIEQLFKKYNIKESSLIYQDSYTYQYNNGKVSDLYLVVPKEKKAFTNYVNLRDSETKKALKLSDDGAFITKQVSQFLKVKKGDLIKIRDKNNDLVILKVAGIIDNYVSNYIYMSSKYYEKVFNEKVKYNNILVKRYLPKNLELTSYDILMATYIGNIRNVFDEFVKGLNSIILMIAVCAALLAFSVLYNLTIINISERVREIATLKVLGFTDREVSVFVYRETLILSIFGSLLGLFLGTYLHSFIMNLVEIDNIKFIVNIKFLSYFLAFIITLVFSYIVQFMVNPALKKIDMVESLKSVE